MKKGLGYLVQQLLSFNTISIDKKELQFQIESHPSYPSLHAVTGVLDHFNVDNLALDVPKNEETILQLPRAFLAQVETTEGKEFVVVINKGLNYQLINSLKNNTTVTIKKFLSQFTGIMVAVEKTEFTNESKKSKSISYQLLLALTFTLATGIFLLIKPSLLSFLFLKTCIVGLALSTAIKKQEQGEQTVLGNAFCSGKTDKKDCNAVLASKGAQIIGNYKLSDISLVYFMSLSVSVFSLTLLQLNLTAPIIMSLLAIPITIYSIYYQAIVLKTWCTLCLSIIGILWIQAAISLIDTSVLSTSSILWIPLAITVLSFLSILSIYTILYPKFTELNALKKSKIEFFKFKRNFMLFNSLLQKSKSIDTYIDDNLSAIVLGNKEAKVQITIVTNPFCIYCKPIHTLIENIHKKYPNEVGLQIRFSANPKDKSSSGTKVVTRLLELYKTKGIELCMEAMSSIFMDEDETSWFKEYGECRDINYYCKVLEKQSNWCIENNINFTPVILINGKFFPKEYDRNDLILFIEDLHENCYMEMAELQLTL